MGGNERQREIRRRRKRRQTIKKFRDLAPKANPGEKARMAEKLRLMSPGGEHLIREMELEQQ